VQGQQCLQKACERATECKLFGWSVESRGGGKRGQALVAGPTEATCHTGTSEVVKWMPHDRSGATAVQGSSIDSVI